MPPKAAVTTTAQAEPATAAASAAQQIVREMREAYATPLGDARDSADTTATAGWQALYAGRIADDQSERRSLAEQLRSLARTLEEAGLDEDGEKSLKNATKEVVELREAMDAFNAQVIQPLRSPVGECEGCLAAARYAARSRETEAPLLMAGLEELVEAAIAGMPLPRWDAERGQVVIVVIDKSRNALSAGHAQAPRALPNPQIEDE